jgi:phosphotransferase system HPr (HPr) family protein
MKQERKEISMKPIVPLSVLLVEDAAPVRQRLRALMADVQSVDLIAEAATVADAVNLFDTVHPQSVVLDIGLPDGSGIDVLRHVRERNSQCVVIVLSNYLDPETYNRCSELGADFLFSKSDEFEQAIETLRALSERMRDASREIAAAARVHRAKLVVRSQIGLRAGTAAMLVKMAQYFDADVDLSLNGRSVNAKSILGILTLGAGYGAEVKVAAKGTDAEEAIHAITHLFESSFHEPRGAAAQPNNGGTILMADDDPIIREVIKRILENSGYQTVVARNGLEAIALLTANPSAIQAVVLDMIMPEMNGAEAMLAIRRMSSDLPVLAISGTEGSEWFSHDTATAFLRKPFGAAELLPALRALLDRGAEWPVGGERCR